jgi:hypothetical protein
MSRARRQSGLLRLGSLGLLAGLLLMDLAASPARALDVPPLRVIADKDPNFNTLWVDTVNDEIVVGNDAHETLQVYSRTANGVVAPLREIKGPKTYVSFPGQVFIDPAHNEIWSVGNDIADLVTVYDRKADGDIAPIRQLSLKPMRLNRTWGLFVDTVHDEVALTHQRRNAVTLWSRTAVTGGEPLRTISGPDTGLANPHGVFIDTTRNEIYVMNLGHTKGSTALPSITVYPRAARGNVAPVRTIQGPETRLDNCGQIYVDAQRGEIVVGNGSPSNDVLVFDQLADGPARPKRIIRGHRTGLSSPTGVFVDVVHDELLVANWGNHTITVYPRDAHGDVPPRRLISPTTSRVTAGIGNPGAIYVDPVHDEIGVIN